MERLRSFLTATSLLILSASSHAATITWGPATDILGDSDVSTSGLGVEAYTFGPTDEPAATVNGVLFDPFEVSGFPTSVTVGNVTVVETQSFLLANNSFGSASTPFADLSASYQSILQSAVYSAVVEDIQLTIDGLDVGQPYEVQVWANVSFETSNALVIQDDGPTLLDNVTQTDGGTGQFALGNFVADSTSQTITFTAVGNLSGNGPAPLINAFQLRAIPEPSVSLLVMEGIVGLAAFRAVRKRTLRA